MYKTTVKIEGMMCANCEKHTVEAITGAFPGAKKVSASHTDNEAVFVTPDEPDAEKITEVITETGYTYVSSESEPYSGGFLSGLFKK